MYLLQLLDHHVCSGTTLLLLALCQSISIGWVYGESRATQPADIPVTKQTKLFARKKNTQLIKKNTPSPQGSDRFYDNIADMIGYRPFPFMKYCWTYITPFICFVSAGSSH